jgi:hypothetical protein
MNDITLSIPAEFVETLISIIEFLLFIAACMIKGAAMLWGICFVIWIACMALTVPYLTIKSLLTKD